MTVLLHAILFVGVSFTAGACLGVVRLEELELKGFLDNMCSFLVIPFVHGFNQAAVSVHVVFLSWELTSEIRM